MECYWKTILLLLVVIISTLTPVSCSENLTNGTESTVASETSTAPKTDSTEESSTSAPVSSVPSSTVVSSSQTSTKPSTTAENSTTPGTTVTIKTDSASLQSTEGTTSASTGSTSPSTSTGSTSPSTTSTSNTSSSTEESTSSARPATASTSSASSSTEESTSSTSPSTTSTSNTSSSTEESTSSTRPATASTSNTSSSTEESTSSTSPSTPPTTTVATTPVTPSLEVVISETNLLLTNHSSKYFVEIQVAKTVDINSTWLVIRNASMDAKAEPLLKCSISINSTKDGLWVYEVTDKVDKLQDMESVLIALYADEESAGNLTMTGLFDLLLYSISGNINSDLKARFVTVMDQNLIIDYKKLNISGAVSLSRCSESGIANNAAVLTVASPKLKNLCNLTVSKPLQMKLTKTDHPCTPTSPTNFQSALTNYVISNVNEEQQCGLAVHMLKGMEVKPVCITEGKEFDVKFTVISAFSYQVRLIMNGYENFLRRGTLNITGEVYSVTNCYEDCFDGPTPSKSSDDRIRVTVAVVVSCIGVFLLVLLFVVLYLRRKRKGMLQFHMTRLDEDDDLAGDMDDFIGNQGPTFNSFR